MPGDGHARTGQMNSICLCCVNIRHLQLARWQDFTTYHTPLCAGGCEQLENTQQHMQRRELLDTNTKKPNKAAKTTIAQIFRDLIALKVQPVTDAVNALIDVLDVQNILDAQDLFDRHRFPDKTIRFHRLANYDNYTLSGLNAAAQAILFLFVRAMSQDGYVAIPVTTICKDTGLTEKTCRQALIQLRQAGIIAQTAAPVRHMPAIYAIDPNLICAGKAASYNDIKAFNDALKTDGQYKPSNGQKRLTARYRHTITHIKSNDRQYGIGQLVENNAAESPEMAKKEPADAGNNGRPSE